MPEMSKYVAVISFETFDGMAEFIEELKNQNNPAVKSIGIMDKRVLLKARHLIEKKVLKKKKKALLTDKEELADLLSGIEEK